MGTSVRLRRPNVDIKSEGDLSDRTDTNQKERPIKDSENDDGRKARSTKAGPKRL